MKNLMVKGVDLFGDTVLAAKDSMGDIWAGVSYICNGIGLSKAQKDAQVEKVQKDLLLNQGCRKFPAGVFDSNNETIALKLDFIPLWLAKISVTNNMMVSNPDLGKKLMRYQIQAKDVLADAFLPQRTMVTYQYPLPAATFEGVANLGRLIERVMKSEGACPHEVATVLKTVFQQSGLEIQDCFVKVPVYEQLSMFGSSEIITRH